MPQKWSKKIVVRRILKRRRGGQKLNSGYMQLHCVPLYQAACNYFGNWPKAIAAAGLKYDDVRITQHACPVRSEKKIIATIRRMHRRRQPLNSNHVQTKETRLYGAACNYFGGWAQAIIAAGLDYAKLRRKDPMRSWSKAAIVAEVIRRAEQGLSIRGSDVSLDNYALYIAAKRHFGKGGWAKARVLAGFDPVDPRPWTKWSAQTVREEILRLYENGAPLNSGAMKRSTYSYIHSAGCVVFGSWAKAIQAAGLNYSKIRKVRQLGWWTKPRIIMCVKSLEKRGIRLSSKSIQLSRGGLFAAAIVLFGSWGQAVEAAGISYRLHTLVWSTKAWLRRMGRGEYGQLLKNAKVHANKRRRSK